MMESSCVRLLPLAALLAAGCVSLSKAYPEKRRFALEAPRRAETSGEPSRGTLRVYSLRVGPLHAGSELVVRTGEFEYESDFYNEWFVPPGAMLTRALEDWLDGGRVFDDVVPSGAGSMPRRRSRASSRPSTETTVRAPRGPCSAW
jgi:cholesterol transport system auxiliary component